MAKVTLVIEDLPEGGADILQIAVQTDDVVDREKITPAQEMAATVLGLIEYAREQYENDSMSEVQEKD
jgi:hypothetical protein